MKKILERLIRIKLVVKILRFFSPGFSHCEKCGLPWNSCKPKGVNYSDHMGTFATCDVCWDNSTLEELNCYYTIVYITQKINMTKNGYKMDHTLEHLLECVKKEYLETHK